MFAPAERAPQETVLRQSRSFQEYPLLSELLDAVPEAVALLNAQRQIVYANRALLDLAQIENLQRACGSRPGEALNCAHAFDSEGGCGTAEFCRTCGAVRAILGAMRGDPEVQECRITRRDADALDLRVHARPLAWNDECFTIASIVDISHEKRRGALERIFFHDVLNSAWLVRELARAAHKEAGAGSRALLAQLALAADRLTEEIKVQRDLAAAENGELQVQPAALGALPVLEETVDAYRGHTLAAGRALCIDPAAADVQLVCDRTLLGRVLGNMLKNALEACAPGETITAGCRAGSSEVEFWVHNPAAMPRDVQLQVFQRSFSTKGRGRGLGTYSMKLISERYLYGRVAFSSTPDGGTTFSAFYPRTFPD